MTTSALIDLLLNYTDNTSSADADNSTRRTRLLQYIQETVDEIWGAREWEFKRRSTTVSVTANSADMPSDFGEFGVQGGVWGSDGQWWEEVNPQVLDDMRQAGNTADRVFAIYGQNTTSGVKKIQTLTQGSALTLTVVYFATPPTLVDATDSTNNLFLIPAQYHNSVVLTGARAKTELSLGDSRSEFDQAYRRGLAQMINQERSRKQAVVRIPMATGMW